MLKYSWLFNPKPNNWLTSDTIDDMVTKHSLTFSGYAKFSTNAADVKMFEKCTFQCLTL
jgi:hypothetical protein